MVDPAAAVPAGSFWRMHDGRECLADFFFAAPPLVHGPHTKFLRNFKYKYSRFPIAYNSLNIRPIKVKRILLGSLRLGLRAYKELSTSKPLFITTFTRWVCCDEKNSAKHSLSSCIRQFAPPLKSISMQARRIRHHFPLMPVLAFFLFADQSIDRLRM